jgi:hypothetical protein
VLMCFFFVFGEGHERVKRESWKGKVKTYKRIFKNHQPFGKSTTARRRRRAEKKRISQFLSIRIVCNERTSAKL